MKPASHLFYVFFAISLVGITIHCAAQGSPGGVGPGSTKLAPLILPEGKIPHFGKIPPVKTPGIKPVLVDSATVAEKAINYRQMLKFLGTSLDKKQLEFLNKNKFLLLPKSATAYKGKVSFQGSGMYPWDEMLGIFDEISGGMETWDRLPENAHLVTPAIVLHAFHKYLANVLEHLEKKVLADYLKDFVSMVRNNALECMQSSEGELSKRFGTIAAQFTVPFIILENSVSSFEKGTADSSGMPIEPEDKGDTIENARKVLDLQKANFSAEKISLIGKELELIYKAGEMVPSPLFSHYSKDGSMKCDYTQYSPRSHYTKSSLLRAYFRAMMFFGRNSYLFETEEGVKDSLLIAYLFARSNDKKKPLVQIWENIMGITGFFAGPSDDIDYVGWRNFIVSESGKSEVSPSMAIQEDFIKILTGKLGKLAPPKILSDAFVGQEVFESSKEDLLEKAKGFRIFGQRFTFDAFILGKLTAGDEKVDVKLPSTPSALFVPSVFGDKKALELSARFYAEKVSSEKEDEKKFLERIQNVKTEICKVNDGEWFKCAGGVWLKVLGTMTDTFGDGYPLYMRSPMFPFKQIQEFLGSFTELKHDTLLYAKQNYAEMGGGVEELKPPPVPKGFVEPNLRFWYEFQRLISFFESGFEKENTLLSEIERFGTLGEFKSNVDLFTQIAEKELGGIPVTEDEYERLRLVQLTDMAKPFDDVVLDSDDKLRSGLVADIHTDVVKNQILYEGNGEPYLLLVLVGNEKTPRLTVGLTFNHYEFTEPLGKRLNDQEWQDRAYKNPKKLPEKNSWYKDLIIQK